MTRAELIARLQQLPGADDIEILVGSWDGCVDTVGSVSLDRTADQTAIVVASQGWDHNR